MSDRAASIDGLLLTQACASRTLSHARWNRAERRARGIAEEGCEEQDAQAWPGELHGSKRTCPIHLNVQPFPSPTTVQPLSAPAKPSQTRSLSRARASPSRSSRFTCTMSSTTDLALLQSSLNTLLRPLPPSSGLPPSLQHALSTSLSHDLRLKLAPGAMRQVVQQLEGLREVGMRRRERNRVREEGEEGAVRVRKGDGWVEELPREWAGAEGREKEKKR